MTTKLSENPILQHLKRYRLTTFDVLRLLPEFRIHGMAALRKELKRLQFEGFIDSAIPVPGWRYWYLTESGATVCRLESNRSGPMSQSAAAKAISMLYFCCLSDRPRIRLTSEELQSRLPESEMRGLPGTYYFDPAGTGLLGLLRLEAGRTGRWDRILQTVRSDVRAHKNHPVFRAMVTAGRFEITIQTLTVTKAARLKAALQSTPEVYVLPVHVQAQPELWPLVMGEAGKEVTRRRVG